MKITIEYDNVEDAKLAMDAFDWRDIVSQLDEILRSTTKYGVYQNREASESELDMADYLREKIREFANDNNLVL